MKFKTLTQCASIVALACLACGCQSLSNGYNQYKDSTYEVRSLGGDSWYSHAVQLWHKSPQRAREYLRERSMDQCKKKGQDYGPQWLDSSTRLLKDGKGIEAELVFRCVPQTPLEGSLFKD